jgi:hypothetical protein
LIMAETPIREFGKRGAVAARPVATPPAAPVKRSSHVALLLMGTFAIGGGAYALMPRQNCEPSQPGMAAPPGAQADAGCRPRSSSGGSSRIGSRSGFFSSDSSSSHSSSGNSSDSGSGQVTRGGFGSFAHGFASHFSGGG